jgi:glycosyltransferase involved in cell wall biosynthesis
MKPFISLCMIVKNEEKVLRRCLDSVKGIVDEIIIVDTGSTDNTKKIAKEYTDKLFDFQWNNNFSEARNYAASKAQGKWILVLDADEYVDPSNLQQAIEEIKKHNDFYDIYAVNIVNFAGKNGENTAQHKHGRIYKNDGTIQFYRSIHEQLKKDTETPTLGLSSLIIYHSGYLSQIVEEKNKKDRNLRLVEHELTQQTSKGFDYFNLGNELKRLGKIEEALNAYIQAYKNKEGFWYGWVPFCLCNIIECLMLLSRYDEALSVIRETEHIYSNVADFSFLKGEIYLQQHRYEDAKNVFLRILSNLDNYNDVVKSPDYKDYLPYRRLGNIYEIEKDYKKAVRYYVKAINVNRYCLESTIRLIRLFSKFHGEVEILNFLSKILNNNNNNKEFVLKILVFVLSEGWSKLGRLLVQHYFNNDLELIKLVNFKADIIEGNFTNYNQEELNTSMILLGINLGIIDVADLLILYRYLAMDECSNRKDMQVIISNSNLYPIVAWMNNKNKKIQIDSEAYLYLVEKCIRFNKLQLLDELISIKNQVQEQIDGKLASVFYKNGYEDIAIEFYELTNEKYLTEQDYVNIIEWLISKGNNEEAYKIAKDALKKFLKDFRFYKYVILLGKQNREHVKEVIVEALSLFGDSEWLRLHFK